MKKTLLRFVLAGLAMSFFACASPQKEKLLSNYEPQFSGNFSPISIPFEPTYKPALLKFTTSVAIYVQLYGKEEGFFEFSMSGKCQVSRLGDNLLWVMDVNEYDFGNTKVRDEISIFHIKSLTDAYGRSKEFDISSPAIESGRLTLKDSKQTYKELLETVRKDISRSFALGCVLPDKPVRTGDILFKMPLIDSIEPLVSSIALTVSEKEQIRKWAIENPFQWVLKGKTFFNGREVLLVSCDRQVNEEKFLSFDKVHLSGIGYQHIDTETSQVLFSEFLFNTSAESQSKTVGDGKIFCKMSGTYSAELLK
jgi:hypothetical protein